MLRKNALSSTSSTDCAEAEGRISLRLNQSANAIGREGAAAITPGGLALDPGGAENAVLLARDLDVEPFLDDVDDLVDHQPHRAAVVGEHQDRLGAGSADIDALHLHQRHQLLAVLD